MVAVARQRDLGGSMAEHRLGHRAIFLNIFTSFLIFCVACNFCHTLGQSIPDLDKIWDAQNYVSKELKSGCSSN
jgi:hypothetical protein